MAALCGALFVRSSAFAQSVNTQTNTGDSGSPKAASTTPGTPPADRALGAGATVCQTQHFRIVCDDNSPTGRTVGRILEKILPELTRSMQSSGLPVKAPTERLPWFCFDDREQYRRHTLRVEGVGVSFPESYYSTRTNHAVVYCGTTPDPQSGAVHARMPDSSLHLLDVPSRLADPTDPEAAVLSNRVLILTHELAHQLAFSSGLQKAGVMYPLWVSEGLATCFERCALDSAGIDSNTIRRQRLVELGRTNRLLRLEDLAVLGGPSALASERDTESQSSPVDVYAQCWGLFRFLLERYPRQLSAYLTDLAQVPAGARESASLRSDFLTHFGSLDMLQEAWRQFIAAGATSVRRF